MLGGLPLFVPLRREASTKDDAVYDGILVLVSGILMPSNGILCLCIWDSFFPSFTNGILACLN